MFGKKDSINNGQNDNDVGVDRELPPVNGGSRGGSKLIPLIFIVLAGLLVTWVVYSMSGTENTDKALAKQQAEDAKRFAVTGRVPEIRQPELPPPNVGGLELPPAPPEQVPATGFYGQPTTPTGTEVKPEWQIIRERRMNSGLAAEFDASKSGDSKAQPKQSDPTNDTLAAIERIYAANAASGGSGAGFDDDDDGFVSTAAPLTNALQPSRTVGTAASLVFDRNLLLAKGSFLDCTLETRLDSTVPGMTACVLSRNIYSDNGKVVLLERGSRVIGEYQGKIQQGQSRIFVLWTRVQTPKGVVIDIDSPGTDALGASGHGGFIDTQFWKRFGGAIMLSLLDDAAALATRNRTQDQLILQNSQDATQAMAVEALKNTINIPPVLRKNQGEHINIYVARDLDFRTVYALRSR